MHSWVVRQQPQQRRPEYQVCTKNSYFTKEKLEHDTAVSTLVKCANSPCVQPAFFDIRQQRRCQSLA